jgi:hypothetical protein
MFFKSKRFEGIKSFSLLFKIYLARKGDLGFLLKNNKKTIMFTFGLSLNNKLKDGPVCPNPGIMPNGNNAINGF